MANRLKNKPDAFKLLSAQLKKEAKQSIHGDITALASLTGKHTNTISAYLSGNVRNLSVASVILTELRKLIANREYEVEKLVA